MQGDNPAQRVCVSCDARLASDNPGPLCSPCKRGLTSEGVRDNQNEPEGAPTALGQTAEAVLVAVRELLEIIGDPHAPATAGLNSKVAATLLTNFIAPGLVPTPEFADLNATTFYDETGRHLHRGAMQFDESGNPSILFNLLSGDLNPEETPLGPFGLHPDTGLEIVRNVGVRLKFWSAFNTDRELLELAHRADWWWEAGEDVSWDMLKSLVQHEPAFLRARREGLSWLRPADREPDRIATSFEARFVDARRASGLPYIQVTLSGPNPPAPEVLLAWYTHGPWKKWQHRLWDGREGLRRRRLPSSGTILRGWTLHTLDHVAGLGLREASHTWNAVAPVSLHLEPGEGPRTGSDSQASKERDRARETAERLQRYLSKAAQLQS